jgi:hypothetical protein
MANAVGWLTYVGQRGLKGNKSTLGRVEEIC